MKQKLNIIGGALVMFAAGKSDMDYSLGTVLLLLASAGFVFIAEGLWPDKKRKDSENGAQTLKQKKYTTNFRKCQGGANVKF